ncbi:MAG: universal stress protein, partial [Kofleriaceae bacterium]
ATVHTLHVVDRRWSPSDLLADPAAIQRDVAAAEATARAELGHLTADARARLGALHEHVTVGRPADEIVRLADQLGAGLIVVGSHGLDAIAHLLVGSVAERVVRQARCPVTVVRASR